MVSNDSDSEIEIYWLESATPKLYRKLLVGQTFEQVTFEGHKWRAVYVSETRSKDYVTPSSDGFWRLD